MAISQIVAALHIGDDQTGQRGDRENERRRIQAIGDVRELAQHRVFVPLSRLQGRARRGLGAAHGEPDHPADRRKPHIYQPLTLA